MAVELARKGIVVRVVQSLRTEEEQNELFAQGRTKPGHKVTNARGGYSWHNFGLAVDLVPGIRGKESWEPNWDAKHEDYATMIAVGEAAGLVSGSRWVHLPDMPHFQMPLIPVNPNDKARTLLAHSGLGGLWTNLKEVECA